MIEVKDRWTEGRVCIDPARIVSMEMRNNPFGEFRDGTVKAIVVIMMVGTLHNQRTFEFTDGDEAERVFDQLLMASNANQLRSSPYVLVPNSTQFYSGGGGTGYVVRGGYVPNDGG